MTTTSLAAALRAYTASLYPLEAGVGLLISHRTFLHRDDFARHLHPAASISDGTTTVWIDWDPVITALDSGHLPSSGTDKRILRIAASLAAGHPVNLRDAIPGLDQETTSARDQDLHRHDLHHIRDQGIETPPPRQAHAISVRSSESERRHEITRTRVLQTKTPPIGWLLPQRTAARRR